MTAQQQAIIDILDDENIGVDAIYNPGTDNISCRIAVSDMAVGNPNGFEGVSWETVPTIIFSRAVVPNPSKDDIFLTDSFRYTVKKKELEDSVSFTVSVLREAV